MHRRVKIYFCHLIIFAEIVTLSACASYNQKVLVKRDRYGESPVVDMRSGASALESLADSDKLEEKQENNEKKHKD